MGESCKEFAAILQKAKRQVADEVKKKSEEGWRRKLTKKGRKKIDDEDYLLRWYSFFLYSKKLKQYLRKHELYWK